jgi:hypothetical protein
VLRPVEQAERSRADPNTKCESDHRATANGVVPQLVDEGCRDDRGLGASEHRRRVEGGQDRATRAGLNSRRTGFQSCTAARLHCPVDPIGYDEYSFSPTKARQRGYADAMRELWSALEHPGSSSSDTMHQLSELEADFRRKQAAGEWAEGGDEDRAGDKEDS